MDPDRPMALLGGLSASIFMRRHWQKKPLLIRAALPGVLADIDRERLFALAAQDGVESRLVARAGRRWSGGPGPIARRALPSAGAPGRGAPGEGGGPPAPAPPPPPRPPLL